MKEKIEIPKFLQRDFIKLEDDKCLHSVKTIEKINMESTPRGRIDYTICLECAEILNKKIWR